MGDADKYFITDQNDNIKMLANTEKKSSAPKTFATNIYP